MLHRFLITAVTAFVFALIGCSSIQPDEPTNGSFNITDDAPVELDFEADVYTTQYHSIVFTNTSPVNAVIENLAFVDNGCGAFSVYNITDASGNILYQAGDAVSVGITAGASVSIQIKFAPSPCSIKAYTTTFIIYHTDGETTKTRSATLNAIVNDNTLNIFFP